MRQLCRPLSRHIQWLAAFSLLLAFSAKELCAQNIVTDNFDSGVLAGVDLAVRIFQYYDPDLSIETYLGDGAKVKKGDVAFSVSGSARSLLTTERLVLNCMQRMSGIATKTDHLVQLISGTKAKLLDTRKTTPNFRRLEKWGVVIGGGENHRLGLYDMIMLKDNHIDFAGGIEKAIENASAYILKNKLDLKIEIETRTLEDVQKVVNIGNVHRIMLDNFTPEKVSEAMKIISSKFETEASGGITLENITDYANTGVDFVSVGALIHQAQSLDMSLKAV